MKKFLLDTNVWLRYFLKDEPEQYKWARKIMLLAEEGRFLPYISVITFLEIHYLLLKNYDLSFGKWKKVAEAILEVRNLVVVDRTDLVSGLENHFETKIKLADYLIASGLPKGGVLVSWDKDFAKMRGVNFLSPEQAVKLVG